MSDSTKEHAARQRPEKKIGKTLPPGVTLLRTLEGHGDAVNSVAFDPANGTLASGSDDYSVKLWDARSGKLLRTLEGHKGKVNCVAFDRANGMLASGSYDNNVKLWDARSGKLVRTLRGHTGPVYGVAFDPVGTIVASASNDETVMLSEVKGGKILHKLKGHQDSVWSVAFDPQSGVLASGSDDNAVNLWDARSGRLHSTLAGHGAWIGNVAFHPQGGTLASSSYDKTIKIWDARTGKLLRTLEGHTGPVEIVTFSPDGRLLGSKSQDQTIRLWSCETWEAVGAISESTRTDIWTPALAFHPTLPLLASAGSDPDTPEDTRSRLIHLWDLDFDLLLGDWNKSTRYRSANVILVGDSGVGKTALAMRLSSERFAATESTHGRRAWMLASERRGTDTYETLLWDLPGQQRHHSEYRWNYRAASVAVVAVDAMQGRESLATAANWSHAIDEARENERIPKLLVLARADGGAINVPRSALADFCREGGFLGWYLVSAKTGNGISELLQALIGAVQWDILPAVTTTPKLKRIRDFLVSLLAHGDDFQTEAPEKLLQRVVERVDEDVSLEELRIVWERLAATGLTNRGGHHTTGKIVLVGDHSVGKSALGYRLIHGRFEKQESTHGQKFWVFPEVGKRRADGTECEAILWDFAGQPDYRLVHALFVDNADLALVLFDASDLRDPLHGVEFWLKQLKADAQQAGAAKGCPIILVAAQTDRGTCSLTSEELKRFCGRHGIVGPITTSAFTGVGIEELLEHMKSLIPWENKAAIVTTTTFKRIKDYVLGLKERDETGDQCIVTPEDLRRCLEFKDSEWKFSDAEMLTAVGHLENYGYVKRLRTSKGELRILLQPERLNNLASSFVLEARRNPKGLGALEEKRLLSNGYDFPEVRDLHSDERDVLLDSAALLFLEHNVCFRETDPLRMVPYLVFPELINLKKPADEETATQESVAYTVSGPTENVFASLVVLLGYTHTFTRTAQWHNNARYEVGNGLVCGFRQEAEREGELDFVLCFAPNVGAPVRTLFQGLFESFMARRNLTVVRYEPVRCSKEHQMNRSVVREAMQHGDQTSFCSKCGEQLQLPKMADPIQLTREVQAEVEEQRQAAEQRTRFEQAVFRVRAYIAEQNITPPECFISYAWGVPEHERWVEKRLAADLQKAGIPVLLDRWHNAQIGSSVARFVERIEECGRVIVVGTPLYRQKAKNVVSDKGSVVAAEWDVAGIRMLATEAQKKTVLPVLLEGEEAESFPPLVRGRVYADFRNDESYFSTAFDLILGIYELPADHSAIADLRESLRAFKAK